MGAPGLANGGTRRRRREDRGAEGMEGSAVCVWALKEGSGERVVPPPQKKISILDLKYANFVANWVASVHLKPVSMPFPLSI